MGVKKCDMIFRLGDQGWTETLYLPGTVDMDVALVTITKLTDRRSFIMAKQTELNEVRVSDVDVTGDSTIQTTGLAGHPNDTLDADNPSLALLARGTLGNRHRRQMWLRGFPKTWTVYSGDFDQDVWTPDFAKWSDSYFEAVLLNGFGAVVKRKVGEAPSTGPVVADYPVTGFGEWPAGRPDPSLTAVLTTLPTAGLVVGQKISIRRARGSARKANGTWIIADTPSVNTIPVALPFANVENYEAADIAKCRAYLAVFDFVLFTSFTRMRIGTKKAGRVIGVPRGRARTRR